MPQVESHLFNKKGTRKTLTLTLEEGDDVMSCIKQGMNEHSLKDVQVVDMQGKLKEGVINYMEGQHYKSMNLKEQEIVRAAGNFKLSFDELFGTMHITTSLKNPLTATFVRGKAMDGLKIKLSFIEITDK